MRDKYIEQLTELNDALIEMGALAERALAKAVRALINRDAKEAREVIHGDDVIDDKEKEIEALALRIIMTQQPVARDLRLVTTALKMITDIERVGDHALDISALCEKLCGQKLIKKLEHIPLMAESAGKMVTDSIDAFVKKDLDLAREVFARDDGVNDLFKAVRADLVTLARDNPENVEQAFDLLQIAKYCERIGDHAVNIAEWAVFSLTGKHKSKRIF